METQTLAIWTLESTRLARAKGFWDDPDEDLNLARAIGLMHFEVSELLEAHRVDPKAPCGKVPGITREEEEVADIFLRLCNYCGARGINLGRVAALKHEYNKGRPARHGKRF